MDIIFITLAYSLCDMLNKQNLYQYTVNTKYNKTYKLLFDAPLASNDFSWFIAFIMQS